MCNTGKESLNKAPRLLEKKLFGDSELAELNLLI